MAEAPGGRNHGSCARAETKRRASLPDTRVEVPLAAGVAESVARVVEQEAAAYAAEGALGSEAEVNREQQKQLADQAGRVGCNPDHWSFPCRAPA